jgi:hypothetical protein
VHGRSGRPLGSSPGGLAPEQSRDARPQQELTSALAICFCWAVPGEALEAPKEGRSVARDRAAFPFQRYGACVDGIRTRGGPPGRQPNPRRPRLPRGPASESDKAVLIGAGGRPVATSEFMAAIYARGEPWVHWGWEKARRSADPQNQAADVANETVI